MKICIHNMKIWVSVGVYKWEKKEKTALLFSLEVVTDGSVQKSFKSDKIKDTICYDDLSKKVSNAVSDYHFDLLESIGNRVLDVLLEDRRILEAKVEIKKERCLPLTEYVSIKIERKQGEKVACYTE